MRVREGILEAVVPVLVESHRDRQLAETAAVPERVGAVAHELESLGELAVRQLLHVQHAAENLVVRRELVEGDLRGPALVEYLPWRLDRDVRVDERAAADGGALRDRHVRKDTQVDPAVLAMRLVDVVEPRIAGLTRIIPDVPASPALQHQHLRAFLRQPAGHDRSAEAAANHHRIECRHRRLLRALPRPERDRDRCFNQLCVLLHRRIRRLEPGPAAGCARLEHPPGDAAPDGIR